MYPAHMKGIAYTYVAVVDLYSDQTCSIMESLCIYGQTPPCMDAEHLCGELRIS